LDLLKAQLFELDLASTLYEVARCTTKRRATIACAASLYIVSLANVLSRGNLPDCQLELPRNSESVGTNLQDPTHIENSLDTCVHCTIPCEHLIRAGIGYSVSVQMVEASAGLGVNNARAPRRPAALHGKEDGVSNDTLRVCSGQIYKRTFSYVPKASKQGKTPITFSLSIQRQPFRIPVATGHSHLGGTLWLSLRVYVSVKVDSENR
jgi:hypothetical protein